MSIQEARDVLFYHLTNLKEENNYDLVQALEFIIDMLDEDIAASYREGW